MDTQYVHLLVCRSTLAEGVLGVLVLHACILYLYNQITWTPKEKEKTLDVRKVVMLANPSKPPVPQSIK